MSRFNNKGVFIGGLLLLVIGIALFIISFALLPRVLKAATNNAILDAVIVDSYKSASYEDWIGQKSVDNYFKQYYYMWNLTNKEKVLKGEKAIYETVGPFNYKYEWRFSNVSFEDDGNLATFTQNKTYKWVADDNTLDPNAVTVTNFNPAYMGLMSQLAPPSTQLGISAEELLFILASGPMSNQFIQYLSNDNFTKVAYHFNGPTLFKERLANVLRDINGTTPNDADPMVYFLQQWSNSTTVPSIGNSNDWQCMLISYSLDSPSSISNKSAMMVLDETNEFSLLNMTSGIVYWINAAIEGPSGESFQMLMNKLELDQAQTTLISIWWLNQFGTNITQPHILAQCNIPSLDYLGVCQFLTGAPLGYRSITDYPNIQSFNSKYSQPFEIAVSMTSNFSSSFSVMSAQNNLFSSDNSILTIQGVALFAQAFIPDTPGSNNFTRWNISAEDASVIFGYLSSYLPVTTGYSVANVLSYYQNSGLIVTRSVQDWLWTCNDELLDFLGVGEQPCSLQKNNTMDLPSTIYTGKNDTTLTNQFVEYQQQKTLKFWPNGPVNVRGHMETGQFSPLQGVPKSLVIFDENLYRPMELFYTSPSSVLGIDTARYYMSDNPFPIDPTFNQSIAGLANLTGIVNGLPTFVSLWDMYGVSSNYSSANVIGLNQTADNADMPLDVEPITGIALYFNIKVQVNLAIPDQSNWFAPSGNWSNIWTPPSVDGDIGGIYYPSFKIGQTATPSPSDINLLKSKFKQLSTVKIAPVVVVGIFSGILLIAGLFMSIYGFRKSFGKYRQNEYQPIN